MTLSTHDSNNVDHLIGALELNSTDVPMLDGELEDASRTLYAGPTELGTACASMTRKWSGVQGCTRIDDGALEMMADPQPPSLFTRPPMCNRIDDDMLEASMRLDPVQTTFRLANGQCIR
jgi:hypothetical protein